MNINRNDAIAAEDMEARVTPFREHGNHFSGNLPFGEEHPEHLVPEDGLQLFQLQGGRNNAPRETPIMAILLSLEKPPRSRAS